VVVVSGTKCREIEWVVNNAQSDDFHLVLLQNPDRYTPHALNIGIKHAMEKGAEIIQMLGAHCYLNIDYFANLAKIVDNYEDVSIFSPCYEFFPAENILERSIQLFHLSRLGRNWQRIYRPTKPVPGFGSGAFAIRSSIIAKTGYFDEKFIRNQDNEFFSRARRMGFKGMAFPELKYYYKTRNSVKKLREQNFDYGRFFALDPFSHSLKQAAPVMFYSFLLLLAVVTAIFYFAEMPKYGLLTNGLFMLTMGIYLAAIMVESFRRFMKDGAAALNLPSILIMMHLYYAMGSFSGFLFGQKKRGDNKKE
jgi:GT2 family glycosyltransferase